MDAIDKILAKHAPSVDDVLARYAPPPGDEDAPGESPEETFLVPGHKRQPARPINNTGPIEQVRADLDPRNAEGHGVLDQAAGAVNSAADRYSMGLFGGALRLARGLNDTGVGRAVNAQIAPDVNRGGGAADAALRSVDEYRTRHPMLSIATDAPAYAVTGPVTATASGINRVLSGAAGRALGPMTRAGLSAAGTSGVIAGNEAASRGESIEEAAPGVASSALAGLAVGAGAGMAGTAIGGAARKVMGSKGAQARRFIEDRGGTVGPGTPGSGSVFEGTPERIDDAAIGQRAAEVDTNVKDMLRGYQDRVAGAPYREAIGAITPEQAGNVVEITPIYRALIKAANDPANLSQAGRLNELVKMIEAHKVAAPGGGELILANEEWLNGLRRGLSTVSGAGQTTAGRMAPLQRAFHEVKAVVDEGPYAEANRRYSTGMSDVDESLDMLGLRRSHNPDEPIAGNLRVKAQRAGQNTVTAGADRPGWDAFKAKHPDMALELEMPELLRAKADLQFHAMPAHGGLIERLAAPISAGVAMAGAAMSGHGLKGLAAIPLAMAVQNATPIAGRFLYGPAQEALALEPSLLQRTDLLQAARNAREERR